jgi:hypothetical protein
MTTTALYSLQMKGCLSNPLTTSEIYSSKAGGNPMKPLFSDVGDIKKTSDKLMFALIRCKFPGCYDEAQ